MARRLNPTTEDQAAAGIIDVEAASLFGFDLGHLAAHKDEVTRLR